MKNIASGKVSIGFAATLFVLAINAVLAYQSITTISRNSHAEVCSDRIITILEQMVSSLKDVERGQREYLLTNNPQYLAAHRIDINQIRNKLKSLVKLKSDLNQPLMRVGTNDPSVQKQQIIDFEQKIDRNLDELVTTIDRRQAAVLTPARQLVLSQQGQQALETVRQSLIERARVERKALERLQAESRQSLADTKLAFGISSLLDLVLLSVLYGLVSWDRTKQQQSEAIVRGYATEFEELYHNAPCGYHSLDTNGKVMRINRTLLQILGYEEAEIVGCKQLGDLLATQSIQKFDDNLAILKKRGWIHDVELQMMRKDGSSVPVSTTVVAIKDELGNYIGAHATTIDIRERVRLRKQARLFAEISQKIRQSLRLEDILATAVEEVQKLLAVDRVLIYRFAADGSGAAVQERVLAGYPAVMGSNINDPCFNRNYHARYTHGRIKTVADITQAGFQPCYLEFLDLFAVKASAIVPIYLRDELWGLLIVHHCQAPRKWYPKEVEMLSQLATQLGIAITQAQLLEQEQLQGRELARSNAELEQFAHVASHDLQEPLRMVISYLQLLSRRYQGKLDADADEFIDYAVDGATRMQALIQGLLSYARVSSRKQPFEIANCHLIVRDAISNLHVAIAESAATITFDPLPEVWGDSTQLTQVFQNLIANGIKFRREVPPKIHISVTPIEPSPASATDDRVATPASWQFAISDNGIGIESQYLDRIFVIFQRLHTRVTYPGTGIGLAICKKIIERHGGTIWVESTPMKQDSFLQPPPLQPLTGSGSIFYFVIPAVGSISPQHVHKQPPD
ncbi:ATP-binding protein [Chamaesiphon minutus]|uniref:histidine kinase n=1 Tax=Chamaesiphon minutus (strain ATCC 27169 / PCC 6605) TaxID=1173020 RepID=K9UMF1_CHAP6|nr:ATP-binding protein [Chamaesiphon minutus]AFY95818.1 PAS domain S-box [Chamaesiphon minutus PCC 6605]